MVNRYLKNGKGALAVVVIGLGLAYFAFKELPAWPIIAVFFVYVTGYAVQMVPSGDG